MREIGTRLFRYFVALAEEQHFERAAVNLDISPPTLTNQIQKLESHLKVKLVERRGNTHAELTEAGKRFLERARNVLREAAEAEAVTRQAARRDRAAGNRVYDGREPRGRNQEIYRRLSETASGYRSYPVANGDRLADQRDTGADYGLRLFACA
jgi:DNA-binding transcriptional LysR family regulator